MGTEKSRFTLLSVLLVVLLAELPASDLVISEFMAVNSTTLLDSFNDTPDWIEIHHQGVGRIDLEGYFLTDDRSELNKWRFPAVSIEGGEYLLVFASGRDRTNPLEDLHTNFRLSATSEYVAIVEPDGETVAFEYAPDYPRQRPDISYGVGDRVRVEALVPSRSSARYLIPTDDSLGTTWTGGDEPFDDSGWETGELGIGYSSAEPGLAVRLAFGNSCGFGNALASALALAADIDEAPEVHSEIAPFIDYYNTGGTGRFGNNVAFPGTEIGVDEDSFVVLVEATIVIPMAGNWTFGVNSDDGFQLEISGRGVTYQSEHPTPRGPADTIRTFFLPSAGEYDVRLVFFECGGGSELELFAAQGVHDSFNGNFSLVGDVRNGGLPAYSNPDLLDGRSGFRSSIRTDIDAEMRGQATSAYVRVPFEVADPAAHESLTLRVKYDDGFYAYLNGTEIARRNVPPSASASAVAPFDRPRADATTFVDLDISDHLGELRAGTNILALHGVNESADSEEFVVHAELVDITVDFRTTGYFETATPGEPNAGGLFHYVADTTFSVDRGFFEEPFEVEISCETPGAVIRYTTDKTKPSLDRGHTYTGPIQISGTTILRAIAYAEGLEPTNVDTQTYIFLDDVLRQTGAGLPAQWGSVAGDYEMDPEIVHHVAYSETIRDDLESIPTMSIVMNERDLFDSGRGIYSNSQQSGSAWEREGSVEIIVPEGFDLPGGNDGVHIDCGVRMHGGVGRIPPVLKHSFRLLFKGKYGATKLNFPLFANSIQLAGGEATDQFDTLVLRAGFNDSWVFQDGSSRTYLTDEFIRGTLLEMGQPNGHGTFVHLYLNGIYWGLFNALERPNAPFASTYMGGTKADWDILNSSEVIDGSKDAWNTAQQLASAGLSTPEDYAAIQEWVDIDNLIHYMLVNFYGGNGDWDHHNWYSGRLRTPGSGYKFFSWDAEGCLGGTTGGDRTGLANGDKPSGLYAALRQNAEFNLRFGDIAHKHCFNGGFLTPTRNAERFRKLADFIHGAMVGESARWGDKGRDDPHTRDEEWLFSVNRMFDDYFPRRTDLLIGFLRGAGLYPVIEAPSFNRHGGEIDPGFHLEMFSPLGTIYYTTDGSDPRLPGGAVNPNALIARSGTGSAPTRTIIRSAAAVRAIVPRDGTLGLDWIDPAFDDSSWTLGTTGVGYERGGGGYDELIGLDVGEEMFDVNGSVYVRVEFEVDEPADIVSLTLRMKYDDGFVAYINGEEVAARNAPGAREWNSFSTAGHVDGEAIVFEDINLAGTAVDSLVSGINVLAIHGLNTSPGSSDMLILPELLVTEADNEEGEKVEGVTIPIHQATTFRARVYDSGLDEWSALNEATFSIGTDLRITEIMYHPPASEKGSPWPGDEFEFVELKNTGIDVIQLERVKFIRGIRFDFGTSEVTSLAPGEITVLVRNLSAFESLYDTSDIQIAGEYEGRLDNNGEEIILYDEGGDFIVHQFRYDDDSYPTTDGRGRSLVVVDEFASIQSWGESTQWMPSDSIDGSPGFDEGQSVPTGRQRTGDSNQDGYLDVSDAVHLLLRLFGGLAAELPCEGDSLEEGSNLALLDLNSDDRVDVSDAIFYLDYLYGAGPAPERGVRCERLEGCPSVCTP